MHFLSVLPDRVRGLQLLFSYSAPLLDVWKLHTFVLFFHAILQRFGEKFVNFERIFLYEPCYMISFFWYVWTKWYPNFNRIAEHVQEIIII